MSSLKNKNIIITGASGGIGNSIVENLYANGANILATGTKTEKLKELKEKYKTLTAEENEVKNTGVGILLSSKSV